MLIIKKTFFILIYPLYIPIGYNLFMLGIDLTKVSRFKNKNDKFLIKTLHPEEIKEYHQSENKELYLATRWAIKEALFKSDNSRFSFNETRIIQENRVYTLPGYIISTSKEDDYVIAIVQKEKNNE